MLTPQAVLRPADYENYRNVRAVALLFIVLGCVFVLGGIAAATTPPDPNKPADDLPPAARVPLFLGLALVGGCGVIGGAATRAGSRKWAWLAKVMACVYLAAFPLGTILGFVLLRGHARYLRSVERLRRADEEDEERRRSRRARRVSEDRDGTRRRADDDE